MKKGDHSMRKLKLLQLSMVRKTLYAGLVLTMLSPLHAFAAEKSAGASASERVSEVLELLEGSHVSAPSKDSLANAAIAGMVDSLKDPYTVYFSEEEWNQFEGSLEQHYVGIGVRVGEDKEGILIVEVFAGTPAEAAGLRRGDIITLDDVVKTILGPEGSTVNLTVKRDDSTFDIKPSRKQVQIPVVVSRMYDNGVGYMQLSSFSSDADESVTKHLDQLKSKGMTSLVFDLRNNGGGLLDSALNIAKLFIKEGVLIHTKDRDNVDDPVVIKNGTTQAFPLYILVNEYSASASEVLTGALQDYGVVAKVIGVNTFGKGSVQQVHPLKGGGALKITIEEYLTPNMRKVNKVGLQPDVQTEGDIPQLITALRVAGVQSFTIQANKRNISVNGADLSETFNFYNENGRAYVPSRVLAALTDASITWNAETETVDITAGSTTASFEVADQGDMINKAGVSYMDVSVFASLFPQLSWSMEGDVLTLTSAKGN
jgi:carboxyl-terminal processing protease